MALSLEEEKLFSTEVSLDELPNCLKPSAKLGVHQFVLINAGLWKISGRMWVGSSLQYLIYEPMNTL